MGTRSVLGVAVIVLVAGCGTSGSSHSPADRRPPTVSVPQVTAAPGASVAWLGGGQVMRGVTPDGRSLSLPGTPFVNGRTGAPGLRSADGAYVYVLNRGRLEVVSALDGKVAQTIDMPPGWTTNAGVASVSADGRWFGLAVAAGSRVRVELFDLQQGQKVASGNIASPSPANMGPAVKGLVALPDGRLLVLAPSMLALVGVRSQRLGVTTQTMEPRLFCDSASQPLIRLAPDGRTLTGYCPFDGSVWWFDLARFRLSDEVRVRIGNPFWGSPAFAPDGSRLYVYDDWDGQVSVVDLVAHRLLRSVQVAPRRTSFHLPFVDDALAKGTNLVATLSADGGTLFMAGPQGGEGGVYVLDTRTLTVEAHWLTGHALQALWAAGDGPTLYAVELRSQTSWVDVVDPGTGVLRNGAAEGAVFDFATP